MHGPRLRLFRKTHWLGLATVAALLLSGCASIGTLEADAGGPGSDESVLVFGVRPADYGIMFFTGTIEAGKFRPAPSTGFIDVVIGGPPRDGYVVARAKAGQTLGLMVVNAPKQASSGGQYHACGGSDALVVKVPNGRIAYVADMEFGAHGNKLNVRYSQRMEAAQQHLRSYYPRLKGNVEQLEPSLVATANDCSTNQGPLIIPIYIPGR